MATDIANMVNLDDNMDPITQVKMYQQFFYECFGDRDWDQYNYNEHLFLKRNIAYAIFGSPNEQVIENDNIQNGIQGYKKREIGEIDDVYKAIMSNHYLEDSGITLMRIIYVCGILKDKKKTVYTEPVFVVKKCTTLDKKSTVQDTCNIFIDRNARVYQSWKAYLENNKLPKCIMFYPRNGKYSGLIVGEDQVEVILDQAESPACKLSNVILDGTDTVGTVASIGSTIVFVAAAIPSVVVAPAIIAGAAVTGVAVGAYSVARSTQTLVDRKKHDQSIGLDNSESRWCWLNTTVGVLGATASAATGLLTRAASKGVEVSKVSRVAFNALNGTNIAGNVLNVSLCSYQIIDRFQNKEKPSFMEIFQLSSSILFFHMSVVNFRTASTIIKDTQSSVINQYENNLRSNRHRRVFKKAQLEAKRLQGDMSGNAEIIRGIQNINDPDNFFAGLARMNKDFNKNGARYTITSDGKIQINSNYIVDPIEFANMNKNARVDILNSLPSYQETPTPISKATFDDNIRFLKDSLRILGGTSDVCKKIILDISNNKFDVDTITLLCKHFSHKIIRCLTQILVQFLNEINNSLEDFKKLYPLTSLPVGALQYLIYYCEIQAKEMEITLEKYLDTMFDNSGKFIKQCLKVIVDSYNTWIKGKIQSLSTLESPIYGKSKTLKHCNICSEVYFETKEN